MKNSLSVLSTAYYPPVQYFSQILNSNRVLIEQHETYPKQTYRNRCYIYSANGVLPLSVPVVRGSFHKVCLKDLKIDNSFKWKKEHLHAIKSAYSSAAFYEYYMDELLKPLKNTYTYLLDMNMDILHTVAGILEMDLKAEKTADFIKDYGNKAEDLRYRLEPGKKEIPGTIEYFQVFSTKFGFKPDLSIIDLIFNMGPESWTCLRT